MDMSGLPEGANINNIEIADDDSSAAPNDLEGFPPYAAYVARSEEIEELISLTSISYALSQQLLLSTPPEQFADITFDNLTPERRSFSMADVTIGEILGISAEWLTYGEYAQKTGQKLQDVANQAKADLLGPVRIRPSDSAPVILWPPESEREADFKAPEIGFCSIKLNFTIKANATAALTFDPSDPVQAEEAQKHFLKSASSLGNVDEVVKRAKFLLFRAAFLLQWTSFEVFLRETIEELLARHPQAIIESAGKKESLSYEQLFSMTHKLSSIESLRQELIDMEIERLRSNGRSIHGMINFLKSAFRFKRDPYKAWYVYKDKRHEATYSTLIDIKERRNTLVHEASDARSAISGKEGQGLSEEEYVKYVLALRSVAYSISSSVHFKEYEVQVSNGPA
ncbi:hypothetical protein [Streptosporangium saharense]|uniref:Uncharacterized protein n=1 Tax=Streptosporangium saharense TaxID=1706840 RepID=A0A7W7VR93_9ACTN|nr:hypothetical protein [Streptosporangium saharense]MBB4919125.1 hypothetical protein [Streptosporangium saharense]